MELNESAAKGCHFCNLVVAAMRRAGRPTTDLETGLLSEGDQPLEASTKRLRSETRYHTDLGVSFILRQDGASDRDYLAMVHMRFQGSAGKSRSLLLFFIAYLITASDGTTNFIEALHTQSESSWNQVLGWIQECSTNHATCQPKSAIVPKKEWPTRLIAVGDADSPIFRLVETSEIDDSKIDYVTLSHCWGSHVPVRLLTDTYATFKEMELEKLPKTFRDAVIVTRNLGLPYLWIDSICIVQDCTSDWATESAKMHHVYKNSHLNIAAAASPDSTGGLFFERSPLEIVPCHVKCGKEASAKLAITDYIPEDETELVLFTRGWVFQEWLLAPRTVIFGRREIHWECCELNASEIRPEGHTPAYYDYRRDLIDLRKVWPKLDEKSTIERWEIWNDVISRYSERKLTRFSDKLVALAGLAADMGKSWNGGEYLAGLWSHHLRSGLLWHCSGDSRWRSCHGPSWSWASVEGDISSSSRALFVDGLAEVVNARVKPSIMSNPYGSVTDGCIHIKGPIVEAQIIKSPQKWIRWRIALVDNWEENEADGLDSFPRSIIEANIEWDDKAIEDMAEVVRVYLVPLEISLHHRGLRLEGLILLPTHLEAGQFRRMGWFRVEDDWQMGDMSLKTLLYNHVSEQETSSDEAESLGSCPQMSPRGDPLRTLLDINDRFKTLDSAADLIDQYAQEDTRILNLKRWMADTTKETTQDWGTSQIEQPTQDDPYRNGVIRTKLLDRYGRDMRDMYPQIHSFLAVGFIEFLLREEDGHLREEIYGESHGNGYFTFQIV